MSKAFKRIFPAAVLFAVLMACTSRKASEQNQTQSAEAGSYFSIIQFAKDQIDTYAGQPFTLVKTVTLNGKTDSCFVQSLRMDWADVLKVFFESDISNPKFLDKYQFTEFEESATDSRVFFYEAKEPGLFTRKLQISVDPLTNKIRSIYVETEKIGKLSTRAQKLFYRPVNLIQIQELERGTLGKDRDLRIQYRFLN